MEYGRFHIEEPFNIWAIDALMKQVGSGMFLNFTVRDCTFVGIQDALIDGALNSSISLPIPFDRFGWFYPVS